MDTEIDKDLPTSTSSLSSLEQAAPADSASAAPAVIDSCDEYPENLISITGISGKYDGYRDFLCALWTGDPSITAKFEYIPNIDQLRAIDKLAELVYSDRTFRTAVREKLGWDWEHVFRMYVSCALDRTNNSVSTAT